MNKNYRFEIIAAHSQQVENGVDIYPIIQRLAEANIFSRIYFNTVLQNMRDNIFYQ